MRPNTAAQHSLLAKQVGFGFRFKGGFQNAGARAANAQRVSQSQLLSLAGEDTKKAMKQILADIQDGTFAKDFLADMSEAGGQVHFNAMRRKAAA